jgi:hypothetical protein
VPRLIPGSSPGMTRKSRCAPLISAYGVRPGDDDGGLHSAPRGVN